MSGWTPSQNDPGSSPNDSDASSADQESDEASRQREQFGLPSRRVSRNDDRPESPPWVNPQPAPQRSAGPTPQRSAGPTPQRSAEPAPPPRTEPVSRPFAAPAPQPSAGPAPQAFTAPATQQNFGFRPEPVTRPGYTPPPVSTTPPGYETQPSRGNQPGYGNEPGYGAQSGYETQPGRGYPPDGTYPEPPRNRGRTWIGIIAGIVILGIVIAGVSVFILKRSSQSWTLTAPSSVAGLSRDTISIEQSAFDREVSTLRSGVTSVPNYGSLKSTVSALYTLGQNQSVGFIGFNGTFNVQVVLKSGPHLKVSKANPGSHGGTAECGQLSPDTLCQWSTPTTVGIIVVIPTSAAARQESIAAANSLMLRIREAVEHSSHGS